MGLETTEWDSAGYLATEADENAYLAACAADYGSDPAMMRHAQAVVERARRRRIEGPAEAGKSGAQ